MTRLSSALGTSAQLRIKQFDLGGHTFKVRVPLVSESDAIHERIMKPDSTTVDNIYFELTKSLNEFKSVENSILGLDLYIHKEFNNELLNKKEYISNYIKNKVNFLDL